MLSMGTVGAHRRNPAPSIPARVRSLQGIIWKMAKQSRNALLRAAWAAAAILLALTTCSRKETEIILQGSPSPYLVTFVGDLDKKEADFLLTIDVDPTSDQRGQPIDTTPIGHHGSVPHHMEYERPLNGDVIFMNAHHKELTMIVDINNSRSINIARTFEPPAPYRFPPDYQRTPNGKRLVGFLRSDGASPDPDEATTPGNHGVSANTQVAVTCFVLSPQPRRA